jgi:hypothetical protein
MASPNKENRLGKALQLFRFHPPLPAFRTRIEDSATDGRRV